MPGKRRFVTAAGVVFVPNVAEDTIEQKVAAGEWAPVVDKPAAVPAPKPARRK